MENKYYTPSVDEFCIGFEFQYKNMQDIWVDLIFEANMIVNFPKENRVESIIYSWLKENKVRVKYLDKSDIESFGFKEDEKVKGVFDHVSERFYLTFDYWLNKDDYNFMKVRIEDEESEYCFSGIIKNKLELGNQLKRCKVYGKV